ncbi:protein of unknown function [Burkholderia multivorans]
MLMVISPGWATDTLRQSKPRQHAPKNPKLRHFNFAQIRHYNFAPTDLISIIHVMSNLVSNIRR